MLCRIVEYKQIGAADCAFAHATIAIDATAEKKKRLRIVFAISLFAAMFAGEGQILEVGAEIGVRIDLGQAQRAAGIFREA